MKNFILIFLIIFVIVACEEEKNNGFDTEEKSIEYVLEKSPMIDKNLKQVRQVNLDSLSITLFRNSKKVDYDEVLVFQKNNQFYAIPFLSNMYFDYWEFRNETQLQLYAKTNTTFEQQFKDVVRELKLKPDEVRLLFDELMLSILHTETNLHFKPQILENFVYSTERVDKYKIEESEVCIARTKRIFEEIKKDSQKIRRYEKYFLDSENGRVYQLITTSHLSGKFSFQIKIYRIDCFSYPLNI
ncbi:hypothetical protein [Chryseobacterium sp. 3008163]|uniref:hypothetical protein n=1 Tax=Chryseobacterium sp. 3008163 TaxID=2478663 RepID=UPI000F0CC626|nr:hypothetical protein [Chryseobacterium sp. 3008163]AYN00635.1 hypothetical protein EAG08_10200 [Chryseobacterium sp. 3008163]